jgi:membrane-associated phospholipid phosphatase
MRRHVLAGLLLLLVASPLRAQSAADSVADSLPTRPPLPSIKAWQVGAVLAGGALTFLALDQRVEHYAVAHQGEESNEIANVTRRFGQPEVYGTVSLGLMVAGGLAGRPALVRSGLRVATSVLLASTVTGIAKMTIGRLRPGAASDGDEFAPVTNTSAAFPSGHTAAAFALATSLADDIHRPLASLALYSLATATGIARIQQDRHWTSDVLVGAVVGIASAKLVGGKWRIFGLQAPAFLVGPRSVGVSVHASF